MHATNAGLYGKGVFTTVAIRDGYPSLWEKHWRRLSSNAAKVGIDISMYDEASVRGELTAAIEKDRIVDGRTRITFFDENPSSIWSEDPGKQTTLSVITGKPRDIPTNFKLSISPYPVNSRSPLAGVKSCNYLENILAGEEARKRGFHEAVRVNECGHVTSAAMANVLWLKDGSLFTPSLTTGCLAGTTREYILENINCREVDAGIEEVDSADAIYLTSAGLGIVAVAEFNGRPMQPADHPITRLSTINSPIR